MRNAYKIFVENFKGRDRSEDQNVDGRMIIVWISEK
jgi:hypothetical protein